MLGTESAHWSLNLRCHQALLENNFATFYLRCNLTLGQFDFLPPYSKIFYENVVKYIFECKQLPDFAFSVTSS